MKESVLMIAIIDDEKQIVHQLKNYLNQMYETQQINLPISVTTFTSVAKFQKSLKNKYDLLIMDIWLDAEITGLDLAQQARAINDNTQVIFISGYVDFLPIENGALKFIPKPITYQKLQAAIVCWLNAMRQRYIEVALSCAGKKRVLCAAEILYIESKGNKNLMLMNRDGNQYLCKGIIKSIELQLAPFNFIRCHHSFFINLQYLKEIKNNKRCGEAIMSLRDNSTVVVPISMRKRREVVAAYGRYQETGLIDV